MPEITPSNIEIIFSDWLDAIRRGDMDTLAARLAPEVTHRGVRAELVCPDRESVLANARARSRAAARRRGDRAYRGRRPGGDVDPRAGHRRSRCATRMPSAVRRRSSSRCKTA